MAQYSDSVDKKENSLSSRKGKEVELKSSTQNKYSLPYGLCAKYGIQLPSDATPTDAWNALKGIGIKPTETYKELQLKGNTNDLKPKGEKVKESIKETQKELQGENDYKKNDKDNPFSEDAYSQERKNSATNSTDPKVYDNMARQKTYDTWKELTYDERFATVDYTSSYSKFNEPLRGIEYGTNKYLGEGNVDLENIGVNYGGYKKGEVKKRIDDLTNAINKSTYNSDVILRRGTGYGGMSNFFKGVSEHTLRNASKNELEKLLVGNTYTDGGFMSCGSTKGKGFNGDIKFSIYCPKGTKMMYVEPVSHYGAKYGVDWKGQKQTHFNSENETVIQRGTSFRVTKVERLPGGKMYVQMEVVAQI